MRLLNVVIGAFLIIELSYAMLLPLGMTAEQQPWAKFPGNPVLTSTPGGWDSDFVAQPRVIYDGNKYMMWYVGGKQIVAIGFAESLDGMTWTKHEAPVLTTGTAGSWDSSEVGLGSVYSDGTRFLMWYRGRSPSYEQGAFGLATSTDGISWTKYSGNPVMRPSAVDQRYMSTPSVLKTSALFNMWYAARAVDDPAVSQVQRILYANSFDGIHWQKYTGVPLIALEPSSTPSAWDSGSVYSPAIYFDGTNYGMWYSALNQTYLEPRIGFATSKDATSWTRFSGNPVLTPGPPSSWDSVGVENPTVITGKLGFMLFYDGISQTVAGSIGLAQPPMGFNIPEFLPPTAGLLIGVAIILAISVLNTQGKRNKRSLR
jgi:predicted GH43/DUF377 family glycosyl hydrolase